MTMAGFYGADTEQVRGFGDELRSCSTRLEHMSTMLAGQINWVEWEGADAEALRVDYSGRVMGLFEAATGLLDTFRHDLDGHAEEQDEASSDGDGILGGVWDFINDPLLNGALGIADGIRDLANKFVRTLGSWSRAMGRIVPPIAIATGLKSLLDPDSSGFDRIAGGLSIVGGVIGGAVVIATVAALPAVPTVIAVTGAVVGIAAGALTLGSEIADNWDSITAGLSDAAGAVGDFLGGIF